MMENRRRTSLFSPSANGKPRKAHGLKRQISELKGQLLAVTQELETYREETRVQTEHLVKTQALLEKSRDRYADLFDFAPLPYLILDRWGVISEVNLPAAMLLQTERSRVVGFPLRQFLELDDRPAFLDHMRRCRSERGQIVSKLRLLTAAGKTVPVQLTSRRSLEWSETGALYATAIGDLSEREEANAVRNELLAQLMAAEESERRRLSRELHDVLGQHVTALSLGLRSLKSEVREEVRGQRIGELLAIADELSQEAHQLALNLRPMALDDLGLASALATYIDDWSPRHGIRAEYHVSAPADRRLPTELETMFYRVVQEALTNVAKHAGARHVNVLLKLMPAEASLIVEDDGCGLDAQTAFESAARAKRLGLLGIRERVTVLGGTLEIESVPEKGTTLFIRVPLKLRRKEVSHGRQTARVSGRRSRRRA